jgi:hypothetical protein
VLPHFVDAKVPGDAEEPSPKRSIRAEFAGSAKDAKECFGSDVFSIGTIAQHSERVSENPFSVQFIDSTQSLGIALVEGGEPALFLEGIVIRFTGHDIDGATPEKVAKELPIVSLLVGLRGSC